METHVANRGMKKGMVVVRAKVHLHEEGARKPGDEFETTEERRKALGDHVEDVPAVEEKKDK